MEIQIATLVRGSESPAGDGLSGAQRCVLRLPDASKRCAILKRAVAGQVMAEALAALLLSAWGLPVPSPFLIDEEGVLAFASADTAYPNLKQSLGLDALPEGDMHDAVLKIAAKLACGLSTTPLAIACDEAIDNRDRNLGNILWDGSAEAWIDHAFSLGQGDHLPDLNKLCDLAIFIGQEQRLQRSAVAHALLLDRDAPAVAMKSLSFTRLPTNGVASIISTRLNSLGNRIIARFPRPADLFSHHD